MMTLPLFLLSSQDESHFAASTLNVGGTPPKLSILIATVHNRQKEYQKLFEELVRQGEGKEIEICVICDAKEISIGKKRQKLLEQARGDYVAFIDDDDWISETYVDDILKALEQPFDCVGFKITCTTNGQNEQSAIASMRYKKWQENVDGYAHARSTYHKTPHKREIALKVGFHDVRYGEDRPYSMGLMNHVATEYFIDKVLYFYRYRTNEPFMQKYGILPPARPAASSRPTPKHGGKIRRDKNGRPI